MRSMLLVACVAAAVLIGGCGPKARRAVFDPAEYEPFKKAGTGAVEGRAFVRTSGGGVVTAAGREVDLVPRTNYSLEWYVRGVLGGDELEPSPPEVRQVLRETMRTTLADVDGSFAFRDLPAGEYFVYSLISWEVPVGYYGGGVASTRTESYVAHAKVTVQDGKTTQAIVTR